MTSIKINLNDFDRINKFVSFLSRLDIDFDVRHARHIVDAKSIMGLLSLDLSRPVELVAYTDDKDEIDKITQGLVQIGAL